MRSSLALLVIVVLLFSLAACQKQQQTSNSELNKPSAAQPASMTITLTTTPAPPVSTQKTAFLVTVADQSGKPVAGADLKADLKMATMDMGKNEVPLLEKKAGSYEGKGKFTMAGPWNVIVGVSDQGRTQQKTFPVVVHKPGE